MEDRIKSGFGLRILSSVKSLKKSQLVDQGKQALPTKLGTTENLRCLVQEIITELVTSVGPFLASCHVPGISKCSSLSFRLQETEQFCQVTLATLFNL